MTPKQKANSLCMKFLIQTTTDIPYGINKTIAKECAVIAVDEVLNSYPHTFGLNKEYTQDGELVTSIVNIRPNISYWQEVKTEIEKL
jgi:hypothetical protein